ncbi:unnamed protein product [Bursaphelenchus okinawaensis]|uniref:FYVE-type domain-containing protein n=1 Tax=Bursaphelenchus okinawaensis TaxID=465554 RepID=A0A811LDE4_9BILA|nr:unnamed protein product [Bursaphelenchus okinawaensis]CAG9120619.1 unnamed protein product [Bursaphelenchus okinawaensis]
MPCTNCMAKYSLIKREHGCPSCGYGFCAKCMSKKAVVERISSKPLAVCEKCYNKINGKEEKPDEKIDFTENVPASFKDVYGNKDKKAVKKKSVEKPTSSRNVEDEVAERLAQIKNVSVDEVKKPMNMVVDSDERDNRPLISKGKDKKMTADDVIQKALDDPAVKNKDLDKEYHEYQIKSIEERLAKLRNVPVEDIRSPRTMVTNHPDLSDSDVELTDDAKELIAMAEKSLRKKEPDLFAYENEALDSDIEDSTDYKH